MSLYLRSGHGVRGMSVFPVWALCRRGMSVFVLDMLRGECVFVFGLARCRIGMSVCLRSRHNAKGISLCLRSWRCVRGISPCLRSWHRVRVKSLCLRSERSAEKECLYVFGLDEVWEEYHHIFILGLVQKTNDAVSLGTQLWVPSYRSRLAVNLWLGYDELTSITNVIANFASN